MDRLPLETFHQPQLSASLIYLRLITTEKLPLSIIKSNQIRIKIREGNKKRSKQARWSRKFDVGAEYREHDAILTANFQINGFFANSNFFLASMAKNHVFCGVKFLPEIFLTFFF